MIFHSPERRACIRQHTDTIAYVQANVAAKGNQRIMLTQIPTQFCTRRRFLAGAVAGTLAGAVAYSQEKRPAKKARIAITFDLEMSRMYPTRDIMEWDYQKGNLNEPTKKYSLDVARIVKHRGGLIHFFCVGRVLEQANIEWLKQIAEMGHPIGNHTYDHVNVWSSKPEQTQFRFRRSPWLTRGRTAPDNLTFPEGVLSCSLPDGAGFDEEAEVVARFRKARGQRVHLRAYALHCLRVTRCTQLI